MTSDVRNMLTYSVPFAFNLFACLWFHVPLDSFHSYEGVTITDLYSELMAIKGSLACSCLTKCKTGHLLIMVISEAVWQFNCYYQNSRRRSVATGYWASCSVVVGTRHKKVVPSDRYEGVSIQVKYSWNEKTIYITAK